MTSAVSIFTPPQSCLSTWIDDSGAISKGVKCSSGTLNFDEECFPATPSGCPSAWGPKATSNGITTCCPDGYDIAESSAARCYSTATVGTLVASNCKSTDTTGVYYYYYSYTSPGVWASVVSYVEIVSTPATSSAPPSSTLNPNTVQTASTMITPLPPSPSPTTRTKSGLSGGAIAGIVIGAIAAIAVAVAAIILLRARLAKPKPPTAQQSYSAMNPQYPEYKPELDSITRQRDPPELQGSAVGQTMPELPRNAR